MGYRGRTVLATDCALADAEAHRGRPLNSIVRAQAMSALHRLEGMQLLSLEHGLDKQICLTFNGCILAAYSSWQSSPRPEQLVGIAVQTVLVSEQVLLLTFASGGTFSISRKDDDYSGPEAFSATFEGGPIVVE